MGVTMTLEGGRLRARLEAEGRPLIIDEFVFAYVPGQDPEAPPDPAAGIPEGVVFRTPIPERFRAFVNPDQVVYSALLGSDVGPFKMNWEGLYSSEHGTLVAAHTFHTLEKRAYEAATHTAGNNLTRNFMLFFSGARELTGITVQAEVWQLDFTTRLNGIDERERLSNRDIYGRSAFLGEGWKLVRDDDCFILLPGVGYVEGIRVSLESPKIVQPPFYPCDVWLDVAQEPTGSDLLTVATPVFLPPGEELSEYVTPPPCRVRHFLAKIGHIPAGNAAPSSSRPGWPWEGLAHVPAWFADLAAQVIRLADRQTKTELALVRGETGPGAGSGSGSGGGTVIIAPGENVLSWTGWTPESGVTVAPLTILAENAAAPDGAAVVARLGTWTPDGRNP